MWASSSSGISSLIFRLDKFDNTNDPTTSDPNDYSCVAFREVSAAESLTTSPFGLYAYHLNDATYDSAPTSTHGLITGGYYPDGTTPFDYEEGIYVEQ
jgi:hypothetical protein